MSTPDADPTATSGGVPVCYRHTDRETYIRCTRCERPICPDCMTSAAVGFQCPECVADGRRTVREVRTRLGASVPTKPYVTFVIIGICVVVFGLQYILGASFTDHFENSPVRVAAFDQYFRLVTAMFLHVNLLHLGMNMLVLWLVGPQLEYVLGHVRYAAVYVLAGIGGSVASFWFSAPYQLDAQYFYPTSSVGASGAIFGLMGAYLVVGRRLGTDTGQVIGLIVVNVAIGFFLPQTDWRAHLGGLVVGALAAVPLAYAPAKRRTLVQVASLAGILVLLVVLTLLRDQVLTQQMITDGINLTSLT